jgi:hypothetical protein
MANNPEEYPMSDENIFDATGMLRKDIARARRRDVRVQCPDEFCCSWLTPLPDPE